MKKILGALRRADETFSLIQDRGFIFAHNKENMPVLQNPCPSNCATKREEAEKILAYLRSIKPDAEPAIFKAIRDSLLID